MAQEFTARLLSKFRVHNPHIRFTPIESGLVIHYLSEQKLFPTELVTREQLISCRIAGTIPESSHARTAELIYYQKQSSLDESRNYTGLALRRRKMLLLFTSYSSARQFVHNVREVFLRNTARKPYVFFLNPRSGSGKAFKIFHKHVVPTLVRLSIPFAVFQTQHAGDVEQWVKTRSDADLSSYRALVTVSGDGLLFEVINGLASRPQSDFNIPIGVVPAGGGNATAGAVCYYSGLAFRHGCLRHSVFILSHPEPSPTDNPMENLHLINRGLIPPKPSEQHASARDSFFQQVITPLDGIVFESMDGKSRRFGILSINWGGFAELDVRSERFRWMGGARFVAAGVCSLLKRRFHPATVYYLPGANGSSSSQAHSENRNSSGDHNMPLPVAANGNGIALQRSSNHRFLPEPDQPIPNGWTQVSGNFWCIMVLNHSHILTNGIMFPEARFHDGQMRLVLINDTLDLRGHIQLVRDMNSDRGLVDTTYMKIIPVLAVRVLPAKSSMTYTLLDGEPICCQAFQAEVQNARFQILTCADTELGSAKTDF
ncbi:hypothetical protein T265_03200 [Opisthorchis viverrini]|uniref:DAGKc domain-containing protein n=2 Tax=Opisthorchis viverrini TaxID=6198 RepID=A0A075AHR9_OPIVI|nr:hypothetical protein T265_03200 [Opisthorchis viverrini]KER30364.1 hypothetical protein T265_03200 [Opisthorchis viverrini]